MFTLYFILHQTARKPDIKSFKKTWILISLRVLLIVPVKHLNVLGEALLMLAQL
jgi:hypothetical protein